MNIYRLYYFQPRSHGLVRFADFDAPSDEAALALALEQVGELAMELWRDHQKLAELDATDVASRVIATRRKMTASHEPALRHEAAE